MASRKPWSVVRPVLVLPLIVGCQSALGSGLDAYHHANYPLAARELRDARHEGIAADEQPRYELYAGLTDLALGNTRGASDHLSRARRTFERDPNYYTRQECASLQSAWRALGKMPGEPLTP